MKNIVLLVLTLALFPVGALTLTAAAYLQGEERFSPWVDARGDIVLPTGFRSTWAHLGSWSVDGSNGESSFHDVYTEPASAEHFLRHREFPDGATLVKEVRAVRADTMTTGRASWAVEPIVWFVMIKDARGRFESNARWGDGWGWSLFDAKDPSTNVTSDYVRECRSCHVPARQTDWVYVQGYPTLEPAPATPAPPLATPPPKASRTDGGLVVTIQDLAFTPNVLRVKPGETVTWINRDDFVHTATADDETFDTGALAAGESVQVTFEVAGTFSYHCMPHPTMKAAIIVEK